MPNPRGMVPTSLHPAAVRAREHRAQFPEHYRARTIVQRAVRDGHLVPGPCETGGDCRGRVEPHHDDYSKPLEVRWLCKRHHAQVDRPKSGKARRGERCSCGHEWTVPPGGGYAYCLRCQAERQKRYRDKRRGAR